MIMKTKKLRHLLTATAVLFSMMLALPRQAQAQNTVTIDGVKKNILSTEFLGGDGDADAFAAYLYLSSDKKEYVRIMGNQKLHAIDNTIHLTSYEPRHDGQWYWSVDYTKNGYGHELFNSYANPKERWSLFSSGRLFITGYPKPPREVCGIILENGKITDSKHGDGNEHTISIDYKYERTRPTAGTLTVGNVTASAISLSWTHGNDNTTPQGSLFYKVWFRKDGGSWTIQRVGNATSYTITGLEPNTKYLVIVRVQDESGNYIDYGQKAVTTPITYPLVICGKSVTSANCGNLSVIPGVSGTVMYNPTTRTLTLQNATLTSSSNRFAGIDSNIDNLKIIVIGTCNVAATRSIALRLVSPSSITGSGTLNATSTSGCGIYLGSKLTIDGCTVKAVGRYGIAGYDGSVEELTIRNANVTAEGAAKGSLRDIKTLTLDGCAITQPAGAAFNASLHSVALGGSIVKSKVVIKPVTTYDLKICGVPVTPANCGNLSVIPGVSGTVMYNPTTRTLTLENATITSPSSGIAGIESYMTNLKINVTGTCSVAATGNAALSLRKPSTITGSGTLNATSPDHCGIHFPNTKLTISGCTVNAVGKYGITGNDGSVEELTIRNANVTAKGTAYGSIRDIKTLTLDGCAITQPAGAVFNLLLHGVTLGGPIVKSEVMITKTSARYDVVLESYNTSKINCIKEVKALTGLNLKESKDLVEAAPCLILESLKLTEAAAARDRIIAAGGTANIYLHGTWTSTGIEAPTADVPAKHRGIYTLQGVKLQGDFDSLPAGIYIIDGRKVVKK